MQHRVASFFKNSIHFLEHQVPRHKTRRRASPLRKDSHALGFSTLEGLFAQPFSGSGNVEEITEGSTGPGHVPPVTTSAKKPDADTHKDHHHRITFPGIPFGRSGKEHHTNASATLDWKLESPPIVFYGDAESSSGALVSGQLFLAIQEDDLEASSFNATLNIHVTQKKPFSTHCHECANQYTELKNWSFLPQPLAMTKGVHMFPFSILLEGHLPASMDNDLLSIAYEFEAEAVLTSNGLPLPTSVKLEKVLQVKRSLPEPNSPHHSIRVFPPTNVKVSVHYPQVIHPIGSNTLSLRMDGVSKPNPVPDTIEYWRLKKVTWRLEETVAITAPACEKHQFKIDGILAQQKGISRTLKRIIGEETHLSGWKSNYGNPHNSSVEYELDYCLSKGARPTCDTKGRDGTDVTHQLTVEMIVSQEWAPADNPAAATQTGVGRVLRMHFACVLTERAGIGISWDNEAPPIYQDVPRSPPAYENEYPALSTSAAGPGVEHIVPLGVLSGIEADRTSIHGETRRAS